MRRSRSSGGAFSLTELLVVIAIIAVVAGLLLPVLARSKGSARQAKCASNLRQLGLAAELFWSDHEDRTFRYRGVAANNGDVFWFGWLERWTGGNEGQRAFDYRQGPLAPYLHNWDAMVCPSFRYDFPKLKLKAETSTCGYGVNLHLTAPDLRDIGAVKASQTIAFADSAQVNTFQSPASPSNPMVEEFYYVSTSKWERTVHFRHRQTANAIYADGHVERERAYEGLFDPRMPGQHIGRIAPERLSVR